MPILGTELKMFRSALVSDTGATNGGVMSFNEIISNVNNNIMPDVPQAERTTGSNKYRKVFYKNTNSADLSLLNPRVFLDKYTQGDDAVYIIAATQTDLQSAISGTPKRYGSGKLDVNVAAGDTILDVMIEDPTKQFFAQGDLVRISNKADVNAVGFEEFATIIDVPTLAGSVVTFEIDIPLANAYTAAATRVANVLKAGAELKPAVSATSVATVGNGDLTFSAMLLGNMGTVYDQWTVTFTSSTAYSVSGARTGAVGSGSTLSDFAPVNPSTGTTYFTIPAAAFTGAWAAGDTATFTTGPASIPLWIQRIVPAGASAISGNKFVVAIDGETA